jgi:hypothetical protein
VSIALLSNDRCGLKAGAGGVHFSITGQGGKVRQVLLPEIVSLSLLSLGGTRILASEVAGATISKKSCTIFAR